MSGATPIRAPVPPVYVALIMEIERRRIARGISMAQMSELMGTAERSYTKMLYPDAGSSSRMARWETLQLAMDVLFCDGYRLKVELRENNDGVHTTDGARRKIKHEAATWHRPLRRQLMSEIGSKGAHATNAARTPEQRRMYAIEAARARWHKVKISKMPATPGMNEAAAQS